MSDILNPALKFTDPKFVEVDINFANFFNNEEIEVMGTWENPLFNAMDVAKFIGDDLVNYSRHIKQTVPAKYIVKQDGKTKNSMYLTEFGLYKYLYACKTDRAENFQLSVMETLQKLRLGCVVTLREKLDDAVLQIAYMDNTIQKISDQRNYAVVEKDWLVEKSQMQESRYHIHDYKKESDHDNHSMPDHYINYWIYEYKYVAYSNADMRMVLPPTFTFEDITEENLQLVYRECRQVWYKSLGDYDSSEVDTIARKLVEKYLQPYEKVYQEYRKEYPFIFGKRIHRPIQRRESVYYTPGNSIFDDDD